MFHDPDFILFPGLRRFGDYSGSCWPQLKSLRMQIILVNKKITEWKFETWWVLFPFWPGTGLHEHCRKTVPENSTTSLQNPSLVHSGDRSFLQTFTPKLPMKFKLTPSSSCLRSNRQQLLPIPHGVLLHACPDGSCAQGQRHSCPLSAGQQRRPWIDKEFFFLFELVCFSGARVLFSSAFVTADAEADRLGYILGGLQSG